MNYLRELGPLAIASRLKNLSELLMRDMISIYHRQHFDFEPRWFTFLHLIHHKGSLQITKIANELNQSHPAANQLANTLEKKGYVISKRDKEDNRKRIIALSNKGKRLVREMEPLWKAVDVSVRDLLAGTSPDFLDHIQAIEDQLMKMPMKKRILSKLHNIEENSIHVVDYQPAYLPHFKTLNYEWLNKFFTIDKSDEEILSNPETILNSGGNIFFAQLDNKMIVGTVAIIHHPSNICELSKMAVTEIFQGKQIGRKLLEKAIGFAREKNYQKMILFTYNLKNMERAIIVGETTGVGHILFQPILSMITLWSVFHLEGL